MGLAAESSLIVWNYACKRQLQIETVGDNMKNKDFYLNEADTLFSVKNAWLAMMRGFLAGWIMRLNW